MRKEFLLLIMSIFFAACSVDNEPLDVEERLTTLDAQTTITVNDTDACNPAISIELCSEEITNPTERGFRNYLRAQIQVRTDLPLSGFFEPSPAELVEQYEQLGGFGTFTSEYSVDAEDCGIATSQLTINVIPCSEPTCADDIFVEVCADEVSNPDLNAIESYYLAQVQIHSDLPLDGTFSPSMDEILNEFNQSSGLGTFTTNYTVNTENCGEVTIEVAAAVSDCTAEPCADDIYVEVCSDEVVNPDVNDLDTFFRAQVQINSDLPVDGTFNPSMEELLEDYNRSSGVGSFVTNYTVNTETCGEVTTEIAVELTDCREYVPSENELYIEVCSEEVVNPDVNEFDTFFRSQIQLATDLPLDGTFNPSMEELLEAYYQDESVGTYRTNYTVNTEDGEVTLEIIAQAKYCME